ncbi:MAG: HlyD family efflux transporter periplasmic adaptor subunit [Candidatus Eremiobacterota bacterium]
MMKRFKMFSIILVIIIILLVIWKFSGKHVSSVKEVVTGNPRMLERLEVSTVWVTGTVKTSVEREVFSETSGVVDKIFVSEGDTVKKGQIMAVLKNFEISKEFNDAKNQLREAQMNVRKLLESEKIETQKGQMAELQAEVSLEDAKTQLIQFEADASANREKVEEEIKKSMTSLQEAENALQLLQEDLSAIEDQAELKLTETEMAEKEAENDLTRLKELFAAKITSQKQLEDGVNAYNRARLESSYAKENLDKIKIKNAQDLQAATLKVEECREMLENARLQASRTEELDKKKIVASRKKLDNSEKLLTVSNPGSSISSDIEIARAKLALAEENFHKGEEKYSTLQIVSPIDGKVALLDKEVKPGKQLQGGSRFFIISDFSSLKIKASVNQGDIASVHEGQEVLIYGNGIYRYNSLKGYVTSIAPMGQPGQREDESKITFEVFIDFSPYVYNMNYSAVKNKISEDKLTLLGGWFDIRDTFFIKRLTGRLSPEKIKAIKSLKQTRIHCNKQEISAVFKQIGLNDRDIQIVLEEKVVNPSSIMFNHDFSGKYLTAKLKELNFSQKEIDMVLNMSVKKLNLRPGMSMDLEFIDKVKENVNAVFSRAIVKEGDKAFVFLYDNGKAKKTEVKTGIANMYYVELTGNLPDKEIIMDWIGDLSDGESVKVKKNY